MELIKCLLTENNCYKDHNKMTNGKPTGIVVHSTGANNPTIKRYVQPSKSDANYNALLSEIGTNVNKNDWNRAKPDGQSICCHAFIGKLASGKIATVQTLPFDICCWGCASGKNGSYNFNPTARVQFEICEDNLSNKEYFDAAFKEAAEFCAYLCNLYNLPVKSISSHAESAKAGYASNHGDPEHWLKKFNKDMSWFRAQVQAIIDKQKEKPAADTPETNGVLYKVQTGAFSKKENAEKQLAQLKAAGFNAIIVKSTINGDFDGDGKLTAADARIGLRKAVGLEE